MSDKRYFNSPWAVSLKAITAFCCLLLMGLPVIGLIGGPSRGCPGHFIWILLMMGMPLCIIFIGMLFMIRGYEVTDGGLRIYRLLWRTEIDLSELISVDVNPKAMSKSMRTFGNGGLFSFCGAFWNRSLGHYRAYATDPANSVVLRFKNKVVVVTPKDPEIFADVIKEFIPY